MNQSDNEISSLTTEDIQRLELDRQSYDKMRAEQCLALDKSIITISGASFGIAIAFIDKIIDKNIAFWPWMFWMAMALLVVSIIATTLSFFFSEKALGFARQCVDDCEYKGDMNEINKQNPHTRRLSYANSIRMWTFILGMAFLGVFILSNGMYQSYYNTQTAIQEEKMSESNMGNNQQGQRPAGPGSGRFGLEPAAPRPQAINPQPQTQPTPPAPQPSSSDKK